MTPDAARMLEKNCSLEIKQLSCLSEKDKDKIRNKDFPKWADPYNQGYYTSELSSQNMVLFSSNQPIDYLFMNSQVINICGMDLNDHFFIRI